MGSQRCQIFGVFDPGTNDLGESGEEMETRSWESVATDESTVLAKPFLDPTVVEDSERNSCFPNSPRPNESNGFEVFGESDDLFDQLVTSEKVPRGRRRRFTKRNARKR